MENSMSRIVIETFVRKTIRDIKDAPERSIRNLVDMALDFSEGRFQRAFFEIAGETLKNENNGYYDIVKDVVANVEEERLLKFGMNLGYNSCTAGASKIREQEKICGYNIPWTIFIQLEGLRLSEKLESYDCIITQGEALGVYTWMLFTEGRLQDVLALIRKHPDSAFVLFCTPKDLTLAFLDCISDVKNVMLAVRYEENAENVYELLRKRQLLYSLYYAFHEKSVESIISGDLFYSTEQLHPVFTAVFSHEDCPVSIKDEVYRTITDYRKTQPFKTIPLDMDHDIAHIDSIISEDSCFAYFDADGWLYTRQGERTPLNQFRQELPDILRLAYPKQERAYDA